MNQKKKGVTCIVCAHERLSEIDFEIASNRRSVPMVSKKYGIRAAEIVAHIRECVETPVTAYVEALERDIEEFETTARGIIKRYGEATDDMEKPSAFDLKGAIDLHKLAKTFRRDALKARGWLASEADVMKSPDIMSLCRDIAEALYHERFAVDGFAAAGVFEEITRLYAGEDDTSGT